MDNRVDPWADLVRETERRNAALRLLAQTECQCDQTACLRCRAYATLRVDRDPPERPITDAELAPYIAEVK